MLLIQTPGAKDRIVKIRPQREVSGLSVVLGQVVAEFAAVVVVVAMEKKHQGQKLV